MILARFQCGTKRKLCITRMITGVKYTPHMNKKLLCGAVQRLGELVVLHKDVAVLFSVDP